MNVSLRLVAVLLFLSSTADAKETLVRNVVEFDTAVKQAQPGDSIVLSDGEWRDAELVFRGTGESYERPILLRAETPGKVEMLGKSSLRIGGRFLRVEGLSWKNTSAKSEVIAFRIDSKTHAMNCVLAECAIVDDVPDAERKWVSLYGTHNHVEHCRFEGKQSRGTLLVVWLAEGSQVSDMDIRDNFFGPRSRLGKNGGEIIRVGDSDTSLQHSGAHVVGNYFYRCDGEAEIISNKSCHNVYGSNTFVGCSGALTFRHGNHCEANENAFFGDGRKGTGGVRVIGEDHRVYDNLFYELTGDDTRAAVSIMNGIPDSPLNGYFQVKQARIDDNTFVRCKESIAVGLRDEDQKHQTLPPTDCSIVRNKVVTKDRPVFFVRTPAVGLQQEGNFYLADKLGLDDDQGWRRDEELAFDLQAFSLPVKPSDVGPAWMRPGDEYLPEVLKKR